MLSKASFLSRTDRENCQKYMFIIEIVQLSDHLKWVICKVKLTHVSLKAAELRLTIKSVQNCVRFLLFLLPQHLKGDEGRCVSAQCCLLIFLICSSFTWNGQTEGEEKYITLSLVLYYGVEMCSSLHKTHISLKCVPVPFWGLLNIAIYFFPA